MFEHYDNYFHRYFLAVLFNFINYFLLHFPTFLVIISSLIFLKRICLDSWVDFIAEQYVKFNNYEFKLIFGE